MRKGFFSAEAGICFIALLLIASVAMPTSHGRWKSDSMQEVFLFQKAGDLLIVWANEGTEEMEMREDAELLLGRWFEIEISGRKIMETAPLERHEKISLEINAMRNGKPEKIRLSVQ